jgi:hypothetical protein
MEDFFFYFRVKLDILLLIIVQSLNALDSIKSIVDWDLYNNFKINLIFI